MRNPLYKRLPRELKSDFGRFAVIFIFVAGMIAIVSGFLVANVSMRTAYDESFEKYNIEDGNFELYSKADSVLIEKLEADEASITVYENFYIEEPTTEVDSTLRIFKNRTDINGVCVMEGELADSADEIAIDRMYADNNKIKVGDTLTVSGKKLTVTGLVALSDYSTLYASPSDLMFDAVKFGVAVMTEEGYNSLESVHEHYSYSWKYDVAPTDNVNAADKSKAVMKLLTSNAVVVNYIPEYLNQAIIFTGDDIGRDGVMFTLFLYLVMGIVAFVFAITTSNTIIKEANVIGTLRASGYTKGELVRHYLAVPMIVVAVAAIVGNVIGYTLIKDYMAEMYYESYSLPTYVTLWNMDAFVQTTVIPLILMFLINLVMLVRKLSISPLKFIRRDLSRKSGKKAMRIKSSIGIMKRFRIRVILQNIPNYVTIIFGIFLANFILLFGLALPPLLDHYQEEITSNMICDYQYVLKAPVETTSAGAEKYCAGALKTADEHMKSEPVTVYGVIPDSKYVNLDFDGKIRISSAYSEKYMLKTGDTIKLREEYGDKEYSFTVGGVYTYPAAIAVFMDKDMFNETFGNESGYFNGYFSDTELTDIDELFVATKITLDDMTKTTRQLDVSMGSIMTLFIGFGVIMFMLIIYMLSKIIIEKNAQAISMTKILGYNNREISGLYILSTAIVVVVTIIATIPLCSVMTAQLFRVAFADYSGWLPYYVPFDVYVRIALLAIAAYAVVAALQMFKVSRIPKNDALKNAE